MSIVIEEDIKSGR